MTNLEVIGAGLGRTGTLSLQAALNELGIGPCHHFLETSNQPRSILNNWNVVANGTPEEADEALKKVFVGYKSLVDGPGNTHYRKLAEWNPEAKVILTIRDTPEKWVKSAQDTIFHPVTSWGRFWRDQSPSGRLLKRLNDFKLRFTSLHHWPAISKLFLQEIGMNPYLEGADLKKLYQDWNKKVQDTIPPKRLLIFNVKEGWVPLCNFLGVPVPDKPFPNKNNSKEFLEVFTPFYELPKVTKYSIVQLLIKFGLASIPLGVYWCLFV